MMNNVQLQGRVAFVNYKEGEGDKKSFISFAISHNTGRKENPNDQYNKENLYRCKAFGPRADFIFKNFPERTQILIEGQLDIGQDYTGKDGNLVKGGVEILISNVHFSGTKESSSNGDTASAKPTIAPKAPAAPAKPTIAPKPVMPAIKLSTK